MANAFITALEAQDAGDEVRVVLDGAGTRWAAVPLLDEYREHPSVRGMLAIQRGGADSIALDRRRPH
jgi:hypothetical protein